MLHSQTQVFQGLCNVVFNSLDGYLLHRCDLFVAEAFENALVTHGTKPSISALHKQYAAVHIALSGVIAISYIVR